MSDIDDKVGQLVAGVEGVKGIIGRVEDSGTEALIAVLTDDKCKLLGTRRYQNTSLLDPLPTGELLKDALALGASGVVLTHRTVDSKVIDFSAVSETRMLAEALDAHGITLLDRLVQGGPWISFRKQGLL